MRKPDRIKRAVDNIAVDYPNGIVYACKMEYLKLLRREAAYQRARVRRIVKTQQRWKAAATLPGRSVIEKDSDGFWLNRHDLLAALKGQP